MLGCLRELDAALRARGERPRRAARAAGARAGRARARAERARRAVDERRDAVRAGARHARARGTGRGRESSRCRGPGNFVADVGGRARAARHAVQRLHAVPARLARSSRGAPSTARRARCRRCRRGLATGGCRPGRAGESGAPRMPRRSRSTRAGRQRALGGGAPAVRALTGLSSSPAKPPRAALPSAGSPARWFDYARDHDRLAGARRSCRRTCASAACRRASARRARAAAAATGAAAFVRQLAGATSTPTCCCTIPANAPRSTRSASASLALGRRPASARRLVRGPHRLPARRRRHAPAARERLDAQPRAARRRLVPDQGPAVDWRLGERWFMRLLLDGDEANNNGNWQWIASVGVDPAPHFRRIYNPALQQRRVRPRRRLRPPLGARAGATSPTSCLRRAVDDDRDEQRRRPAASSARTTRRRSSTTPRAQRALERYRRRQRTAAERPRPVDATARRAASRLRAPSSRL